MAAEVRTEPKTEQPKPEAKEPVVTVIVEENPEPPLKYKTLLLKVSVHCEGCKRKVIKILKNIEGVYKVEIDLRQQKVTVIGNVDSETLISKLLKAGKHAEVWPEKADNKEKKKGKSKNKDKDKDKENKEDQSEQESEDEGVEKEKETIRSTEVVIIQDPSKISDIGINVADKKSGNESEGGGEKTTGGGSGGKKKKKKKNKGHNGNNNNNNVEGGEHSNDAPAGTGSVSQVYGPFGQGPMMSEANHSPPRHPMYQYPVHYYAPPPTVYAVNYNTAIPSASYGASVYAPPSYSYAYMHPGTMSEPQPSDMESYSSEPSGSFEIFSDENPNACSVM
ncbi:Heavy metal transport/detoxification superfamily protein [Euphorbia peplus]|nr:Heavy metal transport/detoxification superfamily protein [Euphorbia peplus]